MTAGERSLLERLEPQLRALAQLAPGALTYDKALNLWTAHAFGSASALRGGPQDALRLRTAAVAAAAEAGVQLDPLSEIGALLNSLTRQLARRLALDEDAHIESGHQTLVTLEVYVNAKTDASAFNRALRALGLAITDLPSGDGEVTLKDCDEDGETLEISTRHYDPDEMAVLIDSLAALQPAQRPDDAQTSSGDAP